MAKKNKTVDGITYAAGVKPAESGSDPEIAAMLAKPGKIRITTMIDEDVLDALKARAEAEGHGHYQTTLNGVLRGSLLQSHTIARIELDRLDVLVKERFDAAMKILMRKVERKIEEIAPRKRKKGKAA